MLSRFIQLNRSMACSFVKPRINHLTYIPQRYFRPGTMNPYKWDPVNLSETERAAQESAPVWDRVFDH